MRKQSINTVQTQEYEDSDEYDVSAIIDHRGLGSDQELKIRWKGFKADDDTWEPRSQVEIHAKIMVDNYFSDARESVLLKIVDHREEKGRLQYQCIWSDGAVKNKVYKRWEPEDIVPMHLITQYFRSPKSV